ncbi:MAG: AzlC family ABC transporter permease [Chloroflexi bacterium]|nr:AzlC family ABC transporter permease [Chloroflexota bacterium]
MSTPELTEEKINSPAARWMSGMASALPIVIGYITIGFAYGVLANKAGLSMLNTLLMSLIVFAGSAQFIAVGLFAAGAPLLSIIATTFVVNLRHLLMSASIAPKLQGWGKARLAWYAFDLTDETFGLHSAHFAHHTPDPLWVFATNLTSQAAWVAGSWLGAAFGQLISDVRPYALDYALPAMFIALLVMQLRGVNTLLVAAAAGVVSTGLMLAGMDQWSVILATLLGATLGMGLELWISKES